MSRQHAGEYWIEPALHAARAADREAMRAGDSVIDDDLDAREVREAFRALKGMTLRTEVAADDGSSRAGNPYVVTENSYRCDASSAPTRPPPFPASTRARP